MKNKLIIFFRETFHLILGFSLLAILFYLRFLPRISRDLYENMTNRQLFFVCLSISCIAFSMYNTLKILGIIKPKELKGYKKNLKEIMETFGNYIIFTLKNLYIFIWDRIEKIASFFVEDNLLHYKILRPLAKSVTTEDNFLYYFVLLMCLKLLPRIIFVTLFVIEAIFYNHLDLTFRCIPFLLLILLEKFFIFMLKDYYDTHVAGISSFITEYDNDDFTETIITFSDDSFDENPPLNCENLTDFFEKHYYPVHGIPVFLEKYDDCKFEIIAADQIILYLQYCRLCTYAYICSYGTIL